MRIFNVILNGADAKEFCHLSTELKISWIQTYTNQTDMDMIMNYINNPPKNADGDCGCGCGENKKAAESKEVNPEKPIESLVKEKELKQNRKRHKINK